MLDWLACVLVRAVSALVCALPPGVAVWLGGRLGTLARWLQPTRARIGERNLRAAFDGRLTPGECRRIIRACYRQLGAGIVEMLRLPVMDAAYLERHIAIERYDRFQHAMDSDRPAILLTGHFGNWELSSIVAALKGHPILALARAQDKLPRLYRLLVSYRESKGCRVIHKGGAMKQLVTALEQGQPVGIVGDQASRHGILVDFFGRPALFATGPFELAYRKGALILPAFIHRQRGASHRLVVESPITLAREQPEADAIRAGIEQFAAILARHITQDPAQWLWMHKRWKHTPARRVLVLSDGKLGHVKQSLAIVDAMRARCPSLTHTIIEIRYRHALARAVALVWSWWWPGLRPATALRWTLHPDAARALLSRYADVIVSCGAAAAPANALWSRENRAKSVVIMNPAPLPLSRFQLVVVPRHDRVAARANIVATVGAFAPPLHEPALREAAHRLASHPRLRAPLTTDRPVVALLIGGDTAAFVVSPTFADALAAQVQQACEALDGWCVVTTSRRTSAAAERALAQRLGRDPRCRLLLLASQDALNGTMEGMLGVAHVAVVTGESISMVSEACASGRRVLVVEPPPRRAGGAFTKHHRFLREVVTEGYAQVVSREELASAIARAVREPRAVARLDNDAVIRDRVAALL